MSGSPIETPTTTVWFDGAVIHIRTKGVPSTAHTLEETFRAVRAVTGGTAHPVLTDARPGLSWEPPTWGTFLANAPAAFTAIAVLIDPAAAPNPGSFQEIIEKFFMPFRLFTDEAEAMAFLGDQPAGA